jgi:acyl-[acyl carrier protein]--UDP-N-acetylglucosamine O-acyltransferase
MNNNDIYNPMSKYHESNIIHETAIIYDNVEIGKNNVIGAYSVIGSNGEMRGVNQSDFKGKVVIGNNNVISELVTIQRPYTDNATIIGDNNIIMAHSHIGHDVNIGSNCEICTGSIIGGYAKISNSVKVKLGVTIRNRKVIGKGALIGLGAVVVKDVADNTIVVGNPAKQLIK